VTAFRSTCIVVDHLGAFMRSDIVLDFFTHSRFKYTQCGFAKSNKNFCRTPETQTAASSDDDEHSADEDYKAVDGVDEEDEENDGEEEEEENEDEDESGESSDDEEEDGEDNGVDETDEHVFPVPSGDTVKEC
jgi:hypothetical protein